MPPAGRRHTAEVFAPPGDEPMRLVLNPLVKLHWHDWGADSVAFEARSGQLFQFDALAAAVMACFEDGADDVDVVTRDLARDLGAPAEGELADTVRALVQEFRNLGWLEPIIA